ncbi:methyltransferase domain-containing protein [Leucobacter soli]|uniref:23S rRNA (Uracil(747)-C(5))-methyltransferase RlmC n=1 Tax=Leucobacter soli TaxID=2812850 RepID=A0A916NLE5_9MICO|nr:23S rRNA (uracil(747)-C(5))-methyltransferase RlmC [Leucobacter soli]
MTTLPMLQCRYFASGECRSCALIETPYDAQLAAKEARCRALLPGAPEAVWLPAFSGGDRGFRNRAKLVVGGTGGRPGGIRLGILGPSGEGVDLRECAIQAPEIAAAIPVLAAFLERTALAPYDVPARRGELKFVHVTLAPSGELMLRFVTRTEHGLTTIRARLGELRALLPQAAVISVNLLPEHRAVLEGEREELLHGSALRMDLGPVALHLRPQSFFQTNTVVARELYGQVASWVAGCSPASVWDLYCGVGGFALHVAAPGRAVLGVELSAAAVDSARRSAREAGLPARFEAADATEFALAAAPEELPELVIVNPPRRGIGEVLAAFLEGSGVPRVVYSSCNPESLAKDLAAMPSYALREARVFDMFPHTSHLEVAVLLERVGG